MASRLRGPRRFRAELVLEVRAGLEEATAALQEAEWPAGSAERQAIADFGSAGRLAADFQPSIASRAARRVGLIGVLMPILMVGWATSWAASPVGGGEYDFHYLLSDLLYLIGAALTVSCVIGLYRLTGRRALGDRVLIRCRRLARLHLVAVTIFIAVAGLLTALNFDQVTQVMGHGLPLVVGLASLILMPMLWVASIGATRSAPGKQSG